MKFGPVTVDRAHLWTSGTTRPKNCRIWSNISRSTGPILAIFTPHESALRADDGSVAYFPICQGSLPWQANNLAFIALVLENELQYHRIAVRISSTNDIVWKFREVCSSNFRVDWAHLWTSGTTRPKNCRILSNISGHTGPIFAIFLP